MKNSPGHRLSRLAIAALTLLVLVATMAVTSSSAEAQNPHVAGAFDGGHPCWDGVSPDGELANGECYMDWGPPVCADGVAFVYNPATGEHCVNVEEPVIELINCPAGSSSSPDGCYILVPKGPRGELYCEDGDLIGELCVIVGPAPIVTRAGLVCLPEFGLVAGKCIRYEVPLTASPECPAGSVEDAAGNCRQYVPGGNKQFTCTNPDATLTDQGCEFTSAPVICLQGELVPALSTGCSEPMPGPYCAGQLVTINLMLTPTSVGTTGDDVVWGTPERDVFFGLGGNDIICAGAGDDLIITGNGDDLVFGEAGDDDLHLQRGNDEAYGGLGDDWIGGRGGKDICDGGPDTDQVAECEIITTVP